MGIEPTYSAWKAEVLPLNYTRKSISVIPQESPYEITATDSGSPSLELST